MTGAPLFPVEPWLVREPTWNPDRLAQTESVFALTNGHLGLRGNPRRGRTARHSRQLSQRRLRAAPAALPRGRLRLSRTGTDHRQRRQRQTHRTGRGRRTVPRGPRPAARPRTGVRPARRRAAPPGRLGVAGRPAVRIGSTRLVPFTRAVAAIDYTVATVDSSRCCPSLANPPVVLPTRGIAAVRASAVPQCAARP